MTARSNIQENLAYAIRFGTNNPVYFGKIGNKKLLEINKIRLLNDQLPITQQSIYIYPNVIKKLQDKRIIIGKMSPEEVADLAYNAIHNNHGRVFKSRFPNIQQLITIKEKVSHIAFVSEFNEIISLKSVYKKLTRRLPN